MKFKSIRNQSISLFIFFSVVLGCKVKSIAQQDSISSAYKDTVIHLVSTELVNRYVFPVKAKKIKLHLAELNKKGHFNEYQLKDFADAVTKSIYDIGKDKHIVVRIKSKNDEDNGEWYSQKLQRRLDYRRNNANFKTVQKLDDNIGYLDLRGFYGLDYGRTFANNTMDMLSTSDAIIIDLRHNSGGRRDMVNYLLSFFFSEQVITGKSIKRNGDNFIERVHRTPKNLSKVDLTRIPLFILTSSKTFSAAEAFSFPLQVYNRAHFIGETTKGGANAGDIISLNDELEIFIPDVASLPHPVSNSIWEGKGIVPDSEVESSRALVIAIDKAKQAAKQYKSDKEEEAKEAIISLNDIVSNYNGKDEASIINAYLNCKVNDIIFEEWELNALGNQLLSSENPETALVIFKTNSILYPNAPNTFDSYAETLMKLDRLNEAVENYKIAVSIGNRIKDDNIELYKSNLENAMIKLASKK